MKALVISLFMIHTVLPDAKGCDICGCAIGSGFSSVLPQFQKNFIGLRATFSRFESRHPDNGILIEDRSQSTELLLRYYLHKRVQFIGSMPYNIKSQKEEGHVTKTIGPGDLAVSLNYTILNKKEDSFRFKQLLLAGAGLKLPTGKSTISNDQGLLNQALQPGSGSLDYLFNASYSIRYKRTGIGNDLQYRMNGENRRKYAFGNKITVASRCFYWIRLGRNYKILPAVGFLYEKMDNDRQDGYVQPYTGGHIYSTSAGCELYYKDLFFSGQYIHPFSQSLSAGNMNSLPRLQINIYQMF